MFNTIAKVVKSVFLFVFIPLLLLFLYTFAVLTWVYSSGERAGYVQKLSEKGFMCKTYEGELILVTMPGTQAEKFYFTVQDEDVAKRINETIGKRVRLVYEQHKGVPTSCFGETEYYVQDVITIAEN
jgi:hypothetical protein